MEPQPAAAERGWPPVDADPLADLDMGRASHVRVGDGARLGWRQWGPWRPRPGAGVHGGQTPVLGLPGLTRTARDFARFAALLDDRRAVVALDYRGRGTSDRAQDATLYGPAGLLADTSAQLTAIGLGRAVVIGMSLGGLLAMALCVQRPGLLAGLVLVDIGPGFKGAGLAHIRALAGAPPVVDSWAAAAAFCRRAFPNTPADLPPAQWLELAALTFRRRGDGRLEADYDPRVVAAMIAATGDGGGPGEPGQLYAATRDIPQLLVRGADSALLSDQTVAEMRAQVPALTVVTVPGWGHVPPLTAEPGCSAILDFVAQCR